MSSVGLHTSVVEQAHAYALVELHMLWGQHASGEQHKSVVGQRSSPGELAPRRWSTEELAPRRSSGLACLSSSVADKHVLVVHKSSGRCSSALVVVHNELAAPPEMPSCPLVGGNADVDLGYLLVTCTGPLAGAATEIVADTGRNHEWRSVGHGLEGLSPCTSAESRYKRWRR